MQWANTVISNIYINVFINITKKDYSNIYMTVCILDMKYLRFPPDVNPPYNDKNTGGF